MSLRKWFFIGIGWLWFGSIALAALDPANAVVEATKAYDQGDYKQAVSLFEGAVASGIDNGHLLYNLGQAYYKQGEKGKAMAAFLGARRYLPRNPDVQANLEFLQNKISDRLALAEPPSVLSTLLFWTRIFTPLELWRGAMITLALMSFAVAYTVAKKYPIRIRNLLLTGFVLPVFLALSGIGAQISTKQWGAVIKNATEIRSGPNNQNPILFALNEGAPFICLNRSGEWLQIRLSDGKKGWVPLDHVKVF